jgi:hypothetical protein
VCLSTSVVLLLILSFPHRSTHLSEAQRTKRMRFWTFYVLSSTPSRENTTRLLTPPFTDAHHQIVKQVHM